MDQPSSAEVADRPRTESPSPEPAPTAAPPTLEAPEPGPTPASADRPRQETAKTIRNDAARQFRGLRFALGCAVAVAITVILTAINVQSGRILDQEGHGWTFRLLFGPDVLSGINLQGWRVVSEAGQLTDPDRYAYLLRLFTAADLAFVIVYFFLLQAVIGTVARGRWRIFGRWALCVLVAIDVLENVLAWPGLFGPWPMVIVTVTTLKWLAVLAVLGSVVLSVVTSPRRLDGERSMTSRLARTSKAVMHQRFSFVPVVVIFILSVPSGAAILEQLPDAQRRWISDGGVGVRQAILAMLATLGLGAFLIVAGWYRSGHAFRHPKPEPEPAGAKEPPVGPPPGEPAANLWVWLVGPVVALAGAVVALATLQGEDILVGRLAAFFLLPVVVIIGSVLLRRRWRRHPREYRPDSPPTFDDRELTAVRLAGHIAGLGAIAVGGLSLLRAYVPLLIVPGTAPLGLIWLFLVIGGTAVIAPWLVALVVIRMTERRRLAKLQQGTATELRSNRAAEIPLGSWVLLVSAVGMFVLLGVFPRLAGWIGLARRQRPWLWARWPGCCRRPAW